MSTTPVHVNGEAAGPQTSVAKKPIQLHPETIALLTELRTTLGFTNDQTVRTALQLLRQKVAGEVFETPESRAARLLGS